MKEDKRKVSLPKNFFQTARPTVSNKDTFKDVTPIKWKITKNSKDNIVHLAKGKYYN